MKNLPTSISENWSRYEKYLFFLLLLINLIPVVGVAYFFTGDGPAHLYNSNIILQLLTHTNGRILDFFELRYELIPNLGGHTLLTALNAFLPAPTAEKVVNALCLLSLPLSFRYLLGRFSKEVVVFAYLAFPLAHNFCFYIGFQSFCLGLSLMLFCIGYFIKIQRKGRRRGFLWLSFLLFLTATFHLFAAIISLIGIGTYYLIALISRKTDFTALLYLGLASLPALIFCGSFILGNSEGFQFNQKSFADLWHGIVAGIPIITIDMAETRFSQPFNLILCAGIGLALFFRIRSKTGFGSIDFSLLTSLLLFAFYFILPDKMASGGFISLRMLLCAYIFLAIWISLSLKNNLLTLLLTVTVIFLNLKLIHYHWLKAKELSADAVAINQAVGYIPESSTVVPLNYSYHWLHYNIGLYLGSQKNLVILDNYEASTTHFPVKWKEETFPGDKLGDFTTNNRPLLMIKPYEKFSGERVDAVVRWKHDFSMTDSLTLQTDSILRTGFTEVFVSDDKSVEVYLRK